MITGKHLDRRMFLRGLGTSVALPLLDAMTPAFAAPAAANAKVRSNAPCRMAFAYVPNGIIMQGWTPAAEGAQFELPRIMASLEPFREHLLVMTGLSQKNGRALGDGPGDHARAAASYLTGVHPRKTAGADIKNGISVDQVAAQAIGGKTKFPSIELGCEHGRQVGNCDSGYSCAYSNSVSWRSETTPMPPEVNPRLVFERLFGSGDSEESLAARAKRSRYNKSILDFVEEDTRRLRGQLGPTDRRKMDEYLTAVREIEQRIEASERIAKDTAPPIDRPHGVPVDYGEHLRLMFELQVVAFQTDLTRVATFMLAREGSNQPYRPIGVSEGHHGLTHHRGNAEWIEKITKINTFHLEQFAWFIGRLKSIQDGDGTLLDHSMVVYGSGIADGNRHTHHDLPVLLVGRGCGSVHTGRHMRYPSETPMNNLFLAMLERVGVKMETLGDSNAVLQQLDI